MKRKVVAILILTLLVIISSSGCMGISAPQLPTIQPMQIPVSKPPSAYVEMKDALVTTAPIGNVTNVTATPTPAPTSRFVYV